jgi:hypothetical protein
MVNVALREIKTDVDGAFKAVVVGDNPSEQPSGVVVAEALGHLLSTVPGTGARRPPRAPNGAGSARNVPKVQVQRRQLKVIGDTSVLDVYFTVEPAQNQAKSMVRASASVATSNGSREEDPPAGSFSPEVLGYFSGSEHLEGDELIVDAHDAREWMVRVATVEGTATVLDLSGSVCPEGDG